MMSTERILMEATFSPKAITYHVLPIGIVLCITIVGIVLLPIIVPLSLWYHKAYYKRLRVVLTSRDLKVHRGIFNRMEKTVPLEKITDLAIYDGPLMRYFGIQGMRVETAGQSSGPGALVSIIGIENTAAFRDMVLNQRDRITDREATESSSEPVGNTSADRELVQTVREMRDALNRIEAVLRDRQAERT